MEYFEKYEDSEISNDIIQLHENQFLDIYEQKGLKILKINDQYFKIAYEIK